MKLYGSRYQKNGATYIRIDSVKLEIRPGSFRIRFENLFRGQKALEEVANDVINQNINLISKDVIPQVERGIERRILIASNQVFERASETEFFP